MRKVRGRTANVRFNAHFSLGSHGLFQAFIFKRNMLVTNPKEVKPTAEKICAVHYYGISAKTLKRWSVRIWPGLDPRGSGQDALLITANAVTKRRVLQAN